MGAYINPQNGQSKEAWLKSNCNSGPLSAMRPWNTNLYQASLPVCLVDNGAFTAAAIAYNEREFNDFNDPHDHRPKVWFIVSIDRLTQVSDLHKYITINEVVEDMTVVGSTNYYSPNVAAQVTETAIDTIATILVVDAISDLFSGTVDSVESLFD